MGRTPAPRRMDWPVRTELRLAAACSSPAQFASACDRGCRQACTEQPKIEQYGEALFIVARTAQILDGRIVFGETHLFVGKGYVISVRHGASASYTAVRERCRVFARQSYRAERTISSTRFSILSSTTTRRSWKRSTKRLRRSKRSIFKKPLEHAAIDRLYTLRRELLRLRNAAVPFAGCVPAARTCRRHTNRRMDAAAFSRRHRSRLDGSVKKNRHRARGSGVRI